MSGSSRVKAALPWLIGLAFVAVEVRRVAGQIAVRYPDFFAWAERAARFDPHHLRAWEWANGLYPFGYPLLLRLGVELGLDVLRTAFLLSILGGVLGLLCTFTLVRRMTGEWVLALFAEAMLACTAHYLFFASLDSTDMLAAGLLIASLAMLMRWPLTWRAALGAGLLAGLSYLIRYTASLTALLSVLYLIGLLLIRREEMVKALPAYLVGAAIGAAPQLIASTLTKGNPFYNIQAHNLWFHLIGSADYIRDWHAVPMEISLWEVIAPDPGRFFGHWWEVFRSFWTTMDGVTTDRLVALLTHGGFFFAVLSPRPLRRPARAFLALYTVGFVLLLSFVRLEKRFLITLMPFQVLGVLALLWGLLPPVTHLRSIPLPLRNLALVLLVAISLSIPLHFMVSNPRDRRTVEVSNLLHAAGMDSASQVFSTHVRYHDVADPWKRRFDMAFALLPEADSYEQLLTFIRQRGYRFFVFDKETGLFLYPEMEFLLFPENRPAGLHPIFVPDRRDCVIYRVEGDWPAPRPVASNFANGVRLVGYTLYRSEDQPPGSGYRVGLYLFWKTERPIERFLKVFVHALDGADGLVTQHDSAPALWTYPTDRWQVDEEIIDFHPLRFDPGSDRGTYTLAVGLYDPETGRRVAVVGADGEPVGDHVVLETFTLP